MYIQGILHIKVGLSFLLVFLSFLIIHAQSLTDTIPHEKLNTVTLTAKSSEVMQRISISNRAINTMAGSFDDPVRLVSRYVGYTNTNDQNNEFSFRGLPPHFSNWQLNGAEIVNPNHLVGAGGASDKFSFGGGVNMFSGNIIEKLNLKSSPNILVENSLSAVADFDLKESSQSYFNFSLIGPEIGLSKKYKSSDLFLNYRYSFTGLLSEMGVDFGGETINYQDAYLGYKKRFKNSILNLNIVYGTSSNLFESRDSLADDFIIKDIQDIDYKNHTFISSTSYSHQINEDWEWNTTVNYSEKQDSRTALFEDKYEDFEFEKGSSVFHLDEKKISVRSNLKKDKFNLGVKFLNHGTELKDQNAFINFDSTFQQNIFSIYANRQLSFFDFNINLGLGIDYFENVKSAYANPVLQIDRRIKSFNLSYSGSINSRNPFYESMFLHVEEGKLIKSINHEFSVKYDENFFIQLLGFYHTFENLPTWRQYSSINGLPFYPLNQLAKTDGSGMSRGVSLHFEYEFDKEFWIQSNATISSVAFQNSENQPYNNAVGDYGFTFNFSISKKLVMKKNKFLQLTVSTIYHQGGYQYPIINNIEVLQNFNSNPLKRMSYFRPDLRIVYHVNKSTFSLDIQNLISRRNEGYYLYNFIKGSEEHYSQLGLIPVLSWKYMF